MAYSIGDRINKVAPHHESIQALWETKWKKPVSRPAVLERAMIGRVYTNDRKCSMGIYPFFDGKIEDFEPVFAELMKVRPPV